MRSHSAVFEPGQFPGFDSGFERFLAKWNLKRLYQHKLVALVLSHLAATVLDEFPVSEDCIVVGLVPGKAADQLVGVFQDLVLAFALVAIWTSKRGDHLSFRHPWTERGHLFTGHA